jgi:hypothetical protein
MSIATPDLVTNSYFPALAAEELGVYREEGLAAHVARGRAAHVRGPLDDRRGDREVPHRSDALRRRRLAHADPAA